MNAPANERFFSSSRLRVLFREKPIIPLLGLLAYDHMPLFQAQAGLGLQSEGLNAEVASGGHHPVALQPSR